MKLMSLLFESKEEEALSYLAKLLKGSPYEGKAFLAGGAVRDQIMGKPVKDIDIVVAEKDGGIEFAKWLTKKVGAYKEGANPVIYPRFGTAKFNLRGTPFSEVDIESVMTRGEKYEQGSRKPEVVYSDLKTDAERRDLTVNSLFKDLVTGEIKDLTGKGIHDIKHGIVRTPLDPDITFKDDPLRMLRTVRFAVKYNWKLPKSLLLALKRNADMLQNISAERIQDELNKILMTDNPDKGLKILSYTGLNKHVIPELDAARGVKQNEYHKHDVFEHILEVVKNTEPDLKARLAALFHDIAKPMTKSVGDDGRIHFYEHEDRGAEMASDIMRRLKYSNDMADSVSKVVKNHMRLKQAGKDGEKVSDKALRKFMAELGDDLESALNMMHADNVSHKSDAAMPNQIKNIASRMKELKASATTAKPKLPINGYDIMDKLNIKPGRILKHLLAAVEDAWFDNPSLSKDDALDIVHKTYKRFDIKPSDSADILKKKIENPKTGNKILVRTALTYDKEHPAHKVAKKLLDK